MLVERVQNLFEHAFEIAHHIVVPKSKHEISHRFEDCRTLFILTSANYMLTTIKLDNQHRISTNKIDDEAIDRHLPLEFRASKSPTA
jgi:hypothetical protein